MRRFRPCPSHPFSFRRRPLAVCLAAILGAPGALAAGQGGTIPTGANLVVTNCDDSGPGSLRDVTAGAVSDDTIDLSLLACAQITLSGGAIVIGSGVTNLAVAGPGQDALSISGNDNDRVFEHQGAGTLTLSALTVTHGRSPDSGGCILAGGNLALTGVTVSACAAGAPEVANNSGGGASVLGNATLDDAHFADNTLDGNLRVRGGALAVNGTLSAANSTFTNNRAQSHTVTGGSPLSNIVEGGAIQVLGETDLVDSTISDNTALSDSYEIFGGGLSVGSHVDDVSASLDIQRGVVTGNTVNSSCDVCAPQGGGIAVVGITRLRQTTLNNNSVVSTNHYGGAGGMRVFDSPSVEIQGSTISGNHADSAGGGLIGPEQGVLSIDATQITGNSADNVSGTNEGGGAVLCFGCSVQLSSSTVSGNVAGANGGGIAVLFGEYAPAPATIINSTISGNTGYEGAGMMLDGGDALFSNSTIAFNQASYRGAGISASEYSYTIELQSTIVSNNLTGTDANNVWAFPDTVSGANNLVPNAAGLPAAMPADTITVDPLLLPLANNGGATPTHALGEGSPAVDTGNNAIGLVFDQRGDGFLREYGVAADIGAFEVQPTTPTDRIFADGFEAL